VVLGGGGCRRDERVPAEVGGGTVDMPTDADVFLVPPGYNAPQQQVHITLGDQAGTHGHDRVLGHGELTSSATAR
jgi:hypothetical protein